MQTFIKRNTILFITSFCILFGNNLLAQEKSSILRESIKNVKSIIESLEIYDQVDKKKFYGVVGRSNEIQFQLKSSPIEEPTSIVIGIATDGSIQEMEVKVFLANEINEPTKLIRTDRVTNEREWVFEILENNQSYLVDIRVIRSKSELSLVELVHSFYYGFQSNSSFSTTKSKTGNPSFQAPKQKSDTLSPIDTYNSFEIFKKDLTK
ncbi:MAG: hypothetical protein GW938_08720 [Leptospira sp.]|jgi:hypothetical protein|nr:hypothetical protein [Leptospira sp.]NCS92406.1 hypothetical protein [Leptospira sp.]